MNAKQCRGQGAAGRAGLYKPWFVVASSVKAMMDERRWRGAWDRDRELPRQDVAEAFDRASPMLIWLLPVLATWLVALIAAAYLLF
jgi:hypothetical protein